MPGEHLTPGFFGKLPSAGDFVSRGLPEAFLRWWDRFCAQHLSRAFADVENSGECAVLRFLLDIGSFGPIAGVVVASNDRVGRRFPLTVASSIPSPTSELPLMASRWLDALEEAAAAARAGELDAAGLEQRLASLPFPATDAGGEPLDGLVLWNDPYELHLVETEAPEETLAVLLQNTERAA